MPERNKRAALVVGASRGLGLGLAALVEVHNRRELDTAAESETAQISERHTQG